MGYLAVIFAAAASWGFGAFWYTRFSEQWMAAAGHEPDTLDMKNPVPHVVSAVAALLVAGMLRHVLASSGITSPWGGAVAGLGCGLFIAGPWIATNYAYARRPLMLTLLDGGYAVIGSTIMGFVLGIF